MSLAENDTDPKRQGRPWLIPFTIAALGGLLFGFDIGCTSSVLHVLSENHMPTAQIGAVASFSLFGALVGSGIALRFGDSMGRSLEIRISALLYTLGALFQALAPLTIPADASGGIYEGILALLGARFVYGLGIGFAMHAAPLYIAEGTPKSVRGFALSAKEAFIVGGILLGYVSGAICYSNFDVEYSWRVMFASAELFAVPFLLGSLGLVESPRWLCLQGSKYLVSSSAEVRAKGEQFLETARLEFLRLSHGDVEDAKKELDGVLETVRYSFADEKVGEQSALVPTQSPAFRLGDVVSSRATRKALTIALGLVVLQQVTGQPSVLYYADRIFSDAGYSSLAPVMIGTGKLAMTLVAGVLVEKAGRKALLLTGASGMLVCLATLSYVFHNHGVSSDGIVAVPLNSTEQSIVLCSVLAYVSSYQISFGPCTWLILSEIFPLRIRSTAMGLGVMTNFGTNLLVTAEFDLLRQDLGESGLFAMFAGLAFVSIVFINNFVIETKNLSLEEIEKKLNAE